MIAEGIRECASRYEIIKSFCEQYKRPFTVCDIGANMCYFGLRLTEDFPKCYVIAFEFDKFDIRATHVKKNKASRLLLLKRKLTIEDLTVLNACSHFDLILALSILHHVGDKFDAWLAALKNLGDSIIAEFATDDSRSRRQATNYHVPVDAEIIGHCPSHIKKDIQRPLVLLRGNFQ